MHGKFQVGQTYQTADWFLGGMIKYHCTKRIENKVWLSEHSCNIDGEFTHDPCEYDILTDEYGEYILLYEYHGHEHRIYAQGCWDLERM